MRLAIAFAFFVASVPAGAQSTGATYESAVANYAATGDVEQSVGPLVRWDKQTLEAAVKYAIARHDPSRSSGASFLEAAALLHLEIGVAIAGISTLSTAAHIELGEQLAASLVPRDAVAARSMNESRKSEISAIRSTWLRVAASAFLSVNDSLRARALLRKADGVSPRNAAILTLQGTAEEIDGGMLSPDDWYALSMKLRVKRERTRIMNVAARLYRDALKADPTYPLAQIRLGHVLHLAGDMKGASQWLAKGGAAAVHPAHRFLAAMFTGAFLQDQNDLDGAREQYERALAIAPLSQNALVALAYIELISGRANQAQALARSHLMTPNANDAWWVSKNGTLDLEGLAWLRQRVRKK